ncbi:hypothetical protein [Amycolatopsis sp. NPDC003731]
MAGIHEIYTREIHKKLGFLACWFPNTLISVGDVGTLRGHRFDRVTSLDDLKIPYEMRELSVAADLNYQSAGKVRVSAGATATAPGAGSGKLSVAFDDAGATLLQASGCAWRELANLPALERELQVLRLAKVWRREWVLVHKVLHTGPAAILVSATAGATVDLEVSADVLAGPLPVANASTALAAANPHGLAARVAVESGATPFFGAIAFQKSLVGPSRFAWRSSEPGVVGLPGSAPASALAEVDWEHAVDDG